MNRNGKGKLASVWELRHEIDGHINNHLRKDRTMIGAISFHAIERLSERRGCAHLLRHINKIQKWNLPADGVTDHKGYKYVTRNGILITVLDKHQKILDKFKEEK